ncbi:MAG: carboxylate-amine ligase [Gaiella sp.]
MTRSLGDLGARLTPAETPEWEAEPPATAASLAAAFERSGSAATIGLEEELMIVDPASWELSPLSERVLAGAGDDPRFHHELRKSQIELVTPVAGNAQAAGIALAAARLECDRRLGGAGRIVASGTHPFSSDWGELAPGRRYRQLADEYPRATAGSIPCGLHVHVAVSGAERALAVYNALRSYLPELCALAANSPFLEGMDSGLASSRRTLTEPFQRAGVPPCFPTWEDFARFVRWGQRGRLFPSAKHLWWDLRPHPEHGTLEVRVADTQTRLEDAVALAAVVQSLVVELAEEFDDAGQLRCDPAERIEENVYRAVRYGVRGWMVDLETGDRATTRDVIGRLIDRLEPTARRLGNDAALLQARALLADNGAERQRYVMAGASTLPELVAWLADETVASATAFLHRRA